METYNRSLVVKEHGFTWIIEHRVDHDTLYFIGRYTGDNDYLIKNSASHSWKHNGSLFKNSNMYFEMFNDFLKGTLDSTKYEIIFPKYENSRNIEIILKKENGINEHIVIEGKNICISQAEFGVLDSLENHITGTKMLINEINVLKEQIAKFNDLYNLMKNFSDTVIQNESNKKIDTQ